MAAQSAASAGAGLSIIRAPPRSAGAELATSTAKKLGKIE